VILETFPGTGSTTICKIIVDVPLSLLSKNLGTTKVTLLLHSTYKIG